MAMALYPSHFTSKTQSGSSNGLSTRVASMGFTRLGCGLFSAGELIFLTGLVFTLTTIWNGIYPLTDYKTMPSGLKPKAQSLKLN
jgi:hypothetical protein